MKRSCFAQKEHLLKVRVGTGSPGFTEANTKRGVSQVCALFGSYSCLLVIMLHVGNHSKSGSKGALNVLKLIQI